MAHLNLVLIHPWRDGNGRMSRLLQTLLLAKGSGLASEYSSIEERLGCLIKDGWLDAYGDPRNRYYLADRQSRTSL